MQRDLQVIHRSDLAFAQIIAGCALKNLADLVPSLTAVDLVETPAKGFCLNLCGGGAAFRL
ncbi:hypothetical protein [Roseinatronobacter monicus]|uniref:Uncharacterized protein n=1 Tax=Roseinatronobacter monicus TaxID=393481 RepID=A0A543K3M7_9RHOB|nr:hypothetical protein [Roseinatronobacter monicus]TQM89690.1 hypothetical protein BD293_4361 [Roseinatronobacter monicus]